MSSRVGQNPTTLTFRVPTWNAWPSIPFQKGTMSHQTPYLLFAMFQP